MERPAGIRTGFDFKRFSLLGERVAATILMTVPEPKLFEPEIVKKIEQILTMAFPNFEGDRRLSAMPYLSLYLARKLMANVPPDSDTYALVSGLITRLETIRDEYLLRAERWDAEGPAVVPPAD